MREKRSKFVSGDSVPVSFKLIENKQREKRGRVVTPPSQIPTVSFTAED